MMIGKTIPSKMRNDRLSVLRDRFTPGRVVKMPSYVKVGENNTINSLTPEMRTFTIIEQSRYVAVCRDSFGHREAFQYFDLWRHNREVV